MLETETATKSRDTYHPVIVFISWLANRSSVMDQLPLQNDLTFSY